MFGVRVRCLGLGLGVTMPEGKVFRRNNSYGMLIPHDHFFQFSPVHVAFW